MMSSKKVGGTCYFLGHSHLDAAWLWPFKETIEVFHDTCETVLKLMDKYPGFHFCQSSAQYYKWMEDKYPETFASVKKRVKEGRWEIVGGSWIEPDGNLPSGESFVRQYLHGKRYFKEKFGVDVQVAWTPDSFGYAWNLPQIMGRCGMKFFLTQKMSWNDTTVFPYYFFKWIAPDGSSVHALQNVGSYSEQVKEGDITLQMEMLTSRQKLNDLLVLFGTGDHGGGVTEDMVERAIEYVDGKKDLRGIFTTGLEFFKTLTRKMEGKKIPELSDEMYLQYHRGTYTTQSNTKKNNRRAECLLETAEKLSTVARRYGYKYPSIALKNCWENLLLNQFHDVLPGSGIPEVYEDSEKCFKSIFTTLNFVVAESLKAIAAKVDTSGEGRPLLLFNPLSWQRTAPIEFPLRDVGDISEIYDDEGHLMPSQIIEREGKLIFVAENVPSIGYREYKAKRTGHKRQKLSTDLSAKEDEKEISIENEYLKVRVDKRTGLVNSLIDKKQGKEVLRSEGNLLRVFDDTPVEGRISLGFPIDAARFDAWEIYIHQQEGGPKCTELKRPLNVKLVENGPVRALIEVKHKYKQAGRQDSLFVQHIILFSKIPLVEFRIYADWRAQHRLAKVVFPLNVHSDSTTYEAPYSSITRLDPTSPRATAAEKAKYEVPGQKWIDHSSKNEGFGVSLLNDCKYGFDVSDDVMGMTLLRSASFPIEMRAVFGLPVDEAALSQVTDQGAHEIRYALYPHSSDFRDALTARRGYEFNCPLVKQSEATHAGDLPKAHSFVSVQPNNVILSVLKKAEDSDDSILRIYETSGQEAQVVIQTADSFRNAVETDLMENETSKLRTQKGAIQLPISKHEIRTIKASDRA